MGGVNKKLDELIAARKQMIADGNHNANPTRYVYYPKKVKPINGAVNISRKEFNKKVEIIKQRALLFDGGHGCVLKK